MEVLHSCHVRKSSGRFRKEWWHSAAVRQRKVLEPPTYLKVDPAPLLVSIFLPRGQGCAVVDVH